MKKYDDINRDCDKFNEIKNEIEDTIESFLIFYYKSNEYVFYSFLERYKKNNPEKSEIDQNFATKYNSIKDILESKFENIEKLKIPKIESLLNELKINKFDLNNKFLLDKEKLKPIYCDNRKETLETFQNFLKKFNNKYNETKKAFLAHIVNESILKNPLNTNFEINKKFMSSLNNENYFSLDEKLKSLYKQCDDIFNFLNYKQYNIFFLTKKELDEMKNNYLNQYLNVYEFDVNSSLKLAIDSFYESFPQKENINENEDEIFPKNAIDNFFSNYENAEKNCYNLNRKILSINRHNNIEKNLKEKEKNLENYTMLLRGYGKEPFLNMLTENLNLKNDKKILESLKFKAKMDSYKTKIDFFLNEIKTHICSLFNEIYIKNIDRILSLKLKIQQDTAKNILKRQEYLFQGLSSLLKECKEYIYNTSKNLIIKNKEVYEEKALKKQVYSTLKFIENIEKKGFKNLLNDVKAALAVVNEQLKIGQEKIQKNNKSNLKDPHKLKAFLLQYGTYHINNYFKIYANYKTIYNDMDIDSLYESSLKQIEEENINS